MLNNYLKISVWGEASANLGAWKENSELASALSLELWVLNSSLQGLVFEIKGGKIRELYQKMVSVGHKFFPILILLVVFCAHDSVPLSLFKKSNT